MTYEFYRKYDNVRPQILRFFFALFLASPFWIGAAVIQLADKLPNPFMAATMGAIGLMWVLPLLLTRIWYVWRCQKMGR